MSLNEASPPPAVSELSVTATLDQDALRAHADEAVAMLKVLGNVDRLMLSARGAKANSSATNWPTNGLCS